MTRRCTYLPVVVMGVSGSGKTTLGSRVAAQLGIPFLDGDALHSERNIEKMRGGHPLTDDDRRPWLASVARHLADHASHSMGIVIACSALKRAYRDQLRTAEGVRFIFLDADRRMIEHRLASRLHHFMPASLADTQFDTLERPLADEVDVCVVDASLAPAEAVRAAVEFLVALPVQTPSAVPLG